MTTKSYQKHLKLMRALGRNFAVGDLYDYRTDCIIKGKYASIFTYIC